MVKLIALELFEKLCSDLVGAARRVDALLTRGMPLAGRPVYSSAHVDFYLWTA